MEESKVKEIIRNEVKSYMDSKIDKTVATYIKHNGSETRSELAKVLREAILAVHKFMWLRKDTWQNDIK